MFSVAFLAFCLGIAATITVQEMAQVINAYRDRKQREFDAAVLAEATKRDRLRQLHADDPFADLDREWNNVKRVTDPPAPYSFD